jgi:hypothetical protein
MTTSPISSPRFRPYGPAASWDTRACPPRDSCSIARSAHSPKPDASGSSPTSGPARTPNARNSTTCARATLSSSRRWTDSAARSRTSSRSCPACASAASASPPPDRRRRQSVRRRRTQDPQPGSGARRQLTPRGRSRAKETEHPGHGDRHCTDAEIESNYVDTHGASVVGFAFTELLNFRPEPCDVVLRPGQLPLA